MRELMVAWRGNPLAGDARSVFDKVVAALPEPQQDELAELATRVVVVPEPGAKTYDCGDDVFDALVTGLTRCWHVRCAYRSRRGRVRRGALEPWALVVHRQALYVVGRFDDGSDAVSEPRTLAMERFIEADFVRGSGFTVPNDFDLRARYETGFGITVVGEAGRVVVDFDACVADLVRARTWHPSQVIETLADGGVRLTLEVADAPELIPWLLGWGPWAEVRRPKGLAKRVAAEHRAAVHE